MAINPFKSKKQDKFTALDFSHNRINLVHCGVDKGEIALHVWQKQRIPAGVINEGIVDNNSILKVAVNNLLQEASYKPGKLIISPAPGQEFIHRMEISDAAEQDIKEIVLNKLEYHLSLSPDDLYCDHLILKKEKDLWQVLLLAIPNGVLDGYKKIFENSPFSPQVANFQSLALVSLLKHQDNLAEVSLIVNMDVVKSRIVIASENDFFQDRITDLGGDNLSWVFKEEKKGWDEKDKSQMKSALNSEEIKEGSETEKIAQKLKQEIDKAMEEQKNKFSQYPVEKIYLTGGFKLVGLRDYLTERIEVDIAVIEPMEGIKLDMYESTKQQRKFYIKDKNLMSGALGLVASEVLHDAR